MFVKPFFILSVDHVSITSNSIREVSIYNSIDMTLPELTFKINDNLGNFASKLNLYIGAIIDVAISETSNELKPEYLKQTNFMQFVITKVFDGFEFREPAMAGYIQVWCKPAWYLFGSYGGHAYAPMKLSELIKKVCQDANTSVKLDIIDDNFEESSDPGNVSRFKCGESDIDFIENKLLPYTNIDDSNAIFFVDWFNRPHLTSFSKLIGQNEKVLFAPPIESASSVQSSIRSISDQKGIELLYNWKNIKLTIGNDNLKKAFSTIKEQVIFENNESGKVYIANQQPKAKLGKDKSPAFNAKMPINAITMEYIEATSCKSFPNRLLPDALALARNDDTNIIDLISVTLEIDAAVDGFIAGDTALVICPIRTLNDKSLTSEEKKKNTHWLNGKWLIKDIQLSQTNGESGNTVSFVTLVRPTIQFNKDTTTIEHPAYFYTVD